MPRSQAVILRRLGLAGTASIIWPISTVHREVPQEDAIEEQGHH